MLAKSLALVLLATFAVAEIPSYINVCGRKNPNLDKCVLESATELRPRLRTGMKELDVPSFEPLELKAFALSEAESFRAYAENVKLFGLTDFEVKSLHVDLENKQFDIDVVFKQIALDADYDVTTKILVPISGKGPIHIEAKNVTAKVLLKFKLVKKNGAEYMFFPTITTKLGIEDYKANFQAADGPDSPLSVAINQALEGSRKEILELTLPNIEKVISEKILELGNKLCKRMTYAELFPDRE